MGQRGPKPKSPILKLLSGNPGPRPIVREGRMQPALALPPAPAWLSAAAKKKYKEVGKELLALGVMTALDQTALAIFAKSCVDLVEIERILRRDGEVLLRPNGFRYLHPATKLRKAHLATLKQFGEALGLTPASREKIRVTEQPAPEPDGLELLKRRAAEANR